MFLNTCVGAKNYRSFLLLISLLVTGTAASVAADVAALAGGDRCSSSYERDALIAMHAFVAALYCVGVAILLSLHACLNYAKMTTNEFALWVAKSGGEGEPWWKPWLAVALCMPGAVERARASRRSSRSSSNRSSRSSHGGSSSTTKPTTPAIVTGTGAASDHA
jgi:hypothetical protein